MALFYYTALTANNEQVDGQMEASSEASVISKLQEMGYFPVSTSLAEQSKTTSSTNGLFQKDISQQDVLLLTQKLAVTMKAGLTLDAALALLIETSESPKLKIMLEKVTLAVHNGVSLSDAFQQYSTAFDRFYLNTLRAGETAGNLPLVLERLSDHLTRSQAIKKQVKAALTYPAVLVSVAVITLWVLLVYVVPQFQSLFEDMGQTLPLPTQIVIALAESVRQYGWLLLLGVVGLFIWVKQRLADPEKRRGLDRLMLSLPLLSEMVVKLEVARFCRTLATLLANGVPILTALSVVSGSLNNTLVRDVVESVKTSVQQGQGVAAALLKQSLFPAMAVQLVRVGEETGELTPMLEKVADIYDEELNDTIQRFLALLEPILIIGLGIIIAAIIVSVLLAILALNDFAV